ncbi:MAG TPA: GTP cyclohydrolase I FolE2, partial [Sulfitobacter sp.]|nr:GTP cyclohydrolase I FolE2 [Sulfitobacter sp.]
MNIAATVIPDRDDAVAALDTLRAWARKASTAEIETLDPSLARLLQSAESYP